MNADAPNTSAPSSADAPPVTADTPAVTADAPTTPATPAKPATWPDWFPAFDTALAILAVVLAFLMASFVARNSDLWRHLAAGRLVTQMQYPVGGDPFSFTAENRVWVNAHWLGETVLYLLFAADQSGAVVVVTKAVAFAAAFGLLFLLRKPGFSLWPWAMAAAAAAVAAGGFTALRPQVFGLPLFAGFLAVLVTGNWAKGSKWKMPAILGGLTVAWANVDSFAFLSPLLIGLMLLGEWLHPRLLPVASDPPADDPFPSAPPRDALLRALLLCAVACLLNPTFLAGLAKDPGEAVAQLVPYELDWQAAEDLKGDRDLSRYAYSVLHPAPPKGSQAAEERRDSSYLDNPAFGKNPSGYTTVVLWGIGLLAAAGGVVLAALRGMGVVGWSFGRLGWVLVWLAFTLLAAVVHARFVPYAVMVGVPLLAATLNALGRRVPPLERLSADAGRGVVMGCQVGRVLSLLAAVVVVVMAVPGWLHPRPGGAGMQRSVGWAVEPDAGLKRAGELFARWHADPERADALADARGLNTHPDLGDYLAYYAPAEKSFVTSRYRLHRTELKDLVAVRRAVLEGKAEEDRDLQVGELVALLKKYEEGKGYTVGYVSIAQAYVPIPAIAVLYARGGMGAGEDGDQQAMEAVWHVDGRLGVVGRLDTPQAVARTRTMGWEAAAFAFGPQPADPPPPPLTRGAPPQDGWEYDLLFLRPPLTPIALEDARGYDLYADLVPEESANRAALLTHLWKGGMAVVGGGPLLLVADLQGGQRGELRFGPLPQYPRQDKEFALPFLIARSARRGLATDPNNAAGYHTLARAFQKPLMPDTEPPREVFRVPIGGGPLAPTESQVQMLTALNRAIARLPDPKVPAERYTALSLETRAALLQMYLQVGPPQQAYTFFLRDKQVQAAPGEISPLGYLDAAAKAAEDLAAAADTATDAELMGVAKQLTPFWLRAFQLCERDFWMEFETFVRNNRVPGKWWQQIEQRLIFDLLTERKYLAADDDPRKWMEKYVQGQRAGQVDTVTLRQKLKRLPAVLEELAKRRADRVNTATRNQPADVAFLGYIQAGLPQKALDMVLVKKGEASQEVAVQTADVLRLMLWVGRAEEAQAYYDDELAKGSADSTSLPPEQRALLRAKFRVIDYELAKLNGDYTRADVLFQEVLATPVSDLGAGRPADSLLFGDQWLAAVYLKPLSDGEKKLLLAGNDLMASAWVGGGWSAQVYANARLTVLRDRLLFDAFTRYQRGVYALLAGDVARAKEHFDAAVTPQGVPLDKLGLPDPLYPPLAQFLPKYRELLAKYADKK